MKIYAMVILALLLATTSAFGSSGELYGRVSIGSGDTLIKGSADQDYSYATNNTLVMPGDTLWVDKEGTVEVELPGLSFLRLADKSKADFVAVQPYPSIRGWIGAFYVQRMSRSTGALTFVTPSGTVDILKDSLVRVDVLQDGATTVSVFWGHASVDSEVGGKVFLRSSQRAYLDPGMMPSTPVRFDSTQMDSFDTWSHGRAKYLALGEGGAPATVFAKSAPVGAYDLNNYGEWVTVDNSPYWRPTIAVDFVPYRSGHWSYVPSCGYVWVGDYPFTYVTSHYGRWRHTPRYGWVWTYRDEWSPAWVASYRYGSNFVWSPLDPFERPAIVVGAATYTVGNFQLSISAMSYCPAETLIVYGPAPVYACHSNIFTNASVTNVYIWNIYSGDNHHRRPDLGPRHMERDYSPRRVIRGLDTLGPQRLSAPTRLATLEKQEGRAQFVAATDRVARNVQTPVNDASRQSRMRKVEIAKDAFTAEPRMRAQSPRDMRNPTSAAPAVGEDSRLARVDEPVGGGQRAPVQQNMPTNSERGVRRVQDSAPKDEGAVGRTLTPSAPIQRSESSPVRTNRDSQINNQGMAPRAIEAPTQPVQTPVSRTRMNDQPVQRTIPRDEPSFRQQTPERTTVTPQRTYQEPQPEVQRPQVQEPIQRTAPRTVEAPVVRSVPREEAPRAEIRKEVAPAPEIQTMAPPQRRPSAPDANIGAGVSRPAEVVNPPTRSRRDETRAPSNGDDSSRTTRSGRR